MSDDEDGLRAAICNWGKSLFDRGLTSGSSGNISVRLGDGVLITPTNSCLGFLVPERLSRLAMDGTVVAGDPPSKEVPLHLGLYEGRPTAKAVVHLHSTFATALSCRSDVDQKDVLPALTPYVLMRAGRVPMLPYADPGSQQSRSTIRDVAAEHAAVLLSNHGPVVSGVSLDAAVSAAEELEEAAKLFFILHGHAVRNLPSHAVNRLLAK